MFLRLEVKEQREKLNKLIISGRLPISAHNIEVITHEPDVSNRGIIPQKYKTADLIIVGFRGEALKQLGAKVFEGYNDLGNLLFVNATKRKLIE